MFDKLAQGNMLGKDDITYGKCNLDFCPNADNIQLRVSGNKHGIHHVLELDEDGCEFLVVDGMGPTCLNPSINGGPCMLSEEEGKVGDEKVISSILG